MHWLNYKWVCLWEIRANNFFSLVKIREKHNHMKDLKDVCCPDMSNWEHNRSTGLESANNTWWPKRSVTLKCANFQANTVQNRETLNWRKIISSGGTFLSPVAEMNSVEAAETGTIEFMQSEIDMWRQRDHAEFCSEPQYWGFVCVKFGILAIAVLGFRC